MCIGYAYMEVGWVGVSQKDIYFFKRRLEDHPISQGGYKILGESNREKGLATGVAGEGSGAVSVCRSAFPGHGSGVSRSKQ